MAAGAGAVPKPKLGAEAVVVEAGAAPSVNPEVAAGAAVPGNENPD